MTEGGISIGCMTASAQDMMYEMLDEIVVESQKEQCIYCMKYYNPDEMSDHHSQCSAYPTECPKCGQAALRGELQSGSHHCPGSENSNGENTDSTPSVGGGYRPPGSGWGGGNPSYGGGNTDSSGGSGYYIYPILPGNSLAKTDFGVLPLSAYQRIPIGVLNTTPEVHLVSMLRITVFQEQTRKYECFARAVANLAKINFNASYENAYNIITKAAENEGIDFDRHGIPLDKIYKVADEYGYINIYTHDAETVRQSIDEGKAVMGMINVPEGYHMVSIVGYDDDNYYCAAGYKEPVCLPKTLFTGKPIVNLIEPKSIYKCKRSLFICL